LALGSVRRRVRERYVFFSFSAARTQAHQTTSSVSLLLCRTQDGWGLPDAETRRLCVEYRDQRGRKRRFVASIPFLSFLLLSVLTSTPLFWSPLGYLLFDGYYLVDLDFQFSVVGEIPSFIDAFKFPPSYWHKVVKAAGNPLLYLDLSGPMGVEIKRNTKVRLAALSFLDLAS